MGDLKGWEEGGLGGDPGEGEGCVPGVRWREVDGEGEDAVALASSVLVDLQCGSSKGKWRRTGHRISTQPLAQSCFSISSF